MSTLHERRMLAIALAEFEHICEGEEKAAYGAAKDLLGEELAESMLKLFFMQGWNSAAKLSKDMQRGII